MLHLFFFLNVLFAIPYCLSKLSLVTAIGMWLDCIAPKLKAYQGTTKVGFPRLKNHLERTLILSHELSGSDQM